MATIATWPAALPRWHAEGYGYKPGDPNARTNMDSGTQRIRRRFISVPTDVTVQTALNPAQLAIFEAWWANSAFAGSATVLLPITNGAGTTSVRCTFKDMYQSSLITGGLWLISVPVRALNLPVANG